MAAPKSKPDDRAAHGLMSVAVLSERVTRPAFGKRGFAGGALLVDWPAIVGSLVSSHALPIQVRFPKGERADGTLVVRVDSGAFALEMQHLEPLVLERVNSYFGWKAVARLKLVQGPLPEAARKPAQIAKSEPADDPGLAARLDNVDDPQLREALARLGRRLTKS